MLDDVVVHNESLWLAAARQDHRRKRRWRLRACMCVPACVRVNKAAAAASASNSLRRVVVQGRAVSRSSPPPPACRRHCEADALTSARVATQITATSQAGSHTQLRDSVTCWSYFTHTSPRATDTWFKCSSAADGDRARPFIPDRHGNSNFRGRCSSRYNIFFGNLNVMVRLASARQDITPAIVSLYADTPWLMRPSRRRFVAVTSFRWAC
ncbi:hypothetical protein E2C01_026783 [Portunus trituberculatus]|uniref:Uncharacterized protein n=1 Tax=Portunus trituberculatus TaxID=210409 RepID=A0A5B7EK60_PORTR|nr:hypothetical protein [Portunus trituberculatus]